MTTSATQYQYQTGTDCWGILYLIGDEYLDQTSSESSLDADEVSSVSPLVIEEASDGYQIKGKVSDNLVDVSVAKVSKGIDFPPPLEQEQQLLEELRKVFGINISRKLVTFKYCIEREALGEGDRVIFKRKSSHTGGELVTTSKGLGIRCEYCQSEHGSFSSFIRHLGNNDLPRLQIVLHKSKETLSWSIFRQRVLDANVTGKSIKYALLQIPKTSC
ncbi:hypothetical protein BKA69DRAFT_341936 [Paraphysoderma sedebokerense]|nr:hypothetical protein BKA69DRAFT_341936 [Paraphysoderma sedebokerense]